MNHQDLVEELRRVRFLQDMNVFGTGLQTFPQEPEA
jgi:hypothetical protein